MALLIPITLVGDNLGKRHKQINTLVNDVYETKTDIKDILNEPEKSAIDRLFKIELASKHRDVDYILENLKDSDLLYVSRALKCSKWLLEQKYRDVINPKNLEDNLYPFMVTTAVTKMKHWVHLNLKDVQRSEEFFKYYCEKEFNIAIQFIFKSSKVFILKEFPKIVNKISPHHFKIFCETCPEIAKLFYDSIATDEQQKSRYLNDEKQFFNSMKSLLKSAGNLYLDITEKYFNFNSFDRFSSIATKFIMTQHKDRFLKKPELYAAWILNIPTLAESLSVEEVKNLVETLARASYLRAWFSYKNVEPLIKRLKPEDRAAFKKKVFVEDDVGEKVEEWPYEPPSAPEIENLGQDIFEDKQHDPYEYEGLGNLRLKKRKLKKRCYKSDIMMCEEIVSCEKVKTVLDKLFDEYRYVGFDKCLYELQKRISAESSQQNRQFIMLVLISKTGGRADAIASLMELLARHGNEPSNLRATVVRSLVKRAFAWRLPDVTWKQLLQFAQGLGLDGHPSETNCSEGLHSVVIRSLLQNGACETAILEAFLGQFSDLTMYSLTPAEKKTIGDALPEVLLSAAKEKVVVKDAIDLISKLVDVLKEYKIKVNTYPGLIETIINLADKDFTACTFLLENLFNNKVSRNELFYLNSKLIHTDDSHLNALKYDINVLDFEKFYSSCLDNNKFEQFFRKIAIYFNEDGGLGMQYRSKLKEKELNKMIGRPLTILLGVELESYLQELDKAEKVETKAFAATIRANAHMSRPNLCIDTFGWRKSGTKMIANKYVACPSVDLDKNIKKLLECKRTARLAFILSKRTNETNVFSSLAKSRPTIAIKVGIKEIKKQGDSFDLYVWEVIKPLVEKVDFDNNTYRHIRKAMAHSVDAMPMKIKPEYCIIIYKAFDRIMPSERYAPMPYFCRIEHLLPHNINEEFLENVISKFLENDFVPDKMSSNYDDVLCTCLYLRIILKYIFISKSEDIQNDRFDNFGSLLLARLAAFYDPNKEEVTKLFFQYLEEILLTLKFTKAFMSVEYVSCLPAMERIVGWMQNILPIEQYFDIYVPIHLTMIYFKAIRQTVQQIPGIFDNEKRKLKEGVSVVGNLFGKYIAREAKDLIAKYFDSIIDLYRDCLITYLDDYFNYTQSTDFLSSLIKGILDESKGDESRLGLYVLKEKYYSIGENVSDEIIKNFEDVNNLKNKFFVFGELLT